MNATLSRDGWSLKFDIDDITCFYFCDHFFKAFKNSSNIKNACTLKVHSSREILCYCATCNDEIKKLLDNYDALSDEFFLRERNF